MWSQSIKSIIIPPWPKIKIIIPQGLFFAESRKYYLRRQVPMTQGSNFPNWNRRDNTKISFGRSFERQIPISFAFWRRRCRNHCYCCLHLLDWSAAILSQLNMNIFKKPDPKGSPSDLVPISTVLIHWVAAWSFTLTSQRLKTFACDCRVSERE